MSGLNKVGSNVIQVAKKEVKEIKQPKQDNKLALESSPNPNSNVKPKKMNAKHIAEAAPINAPKFENPKKETKRVQTVQLKVNLSKLAPDNKPGLATLKERSKMVFDTIEKMVDKKIIDTRKSSTTVVTMPEFFLNDASKTMSPPEMEQAITYLKDLAKNEKFENLVFTPGSMLAMHPAPAMKHIKSSDLQTIAETMKLDINEVKEAYAEMTSSSEEKYEKVSNVRKALIGVGDQLNKKVANAAKNNNKVNITKEVIADICKTIKDPSNLKINPRSGFKQMQNCILVMEGGKNGQNKLINKTAPSDIDSALRSDKKKNSDKYEDQLVYYPAKTMFKDNRKQIINKASHVGINADSFAFHSPKNDFDMAVAICLDYSEQIYAGIADEKNKNKIDQLHVSSAGVGMRTVNKSYGMSKSAFSLNDGFGSALSADVSTGDLDKYYLRDKEAVGISYSIKNETFSAEPTNFEKKEFYSDMKDNLAFQIDAPIHKPRTVSNASSVSSFDGNPNVGMQELLGKNEKMPNNMKSLFPTKETIKNEDSKWKENIMKKEQEVKDMGNRIAILDRLLGKEPTQKDWDDAFNDPVLKKLVAKKNVPKIKNKKNSKKPKVTYSKVPFNKLAKKIGGIGNFRTEHNNLRDEKLVELNKLREGKL
ncbi:hypothetical protein [Acanthopleuribacter pedis]|uniref:Uncharacterized protein n=1 Tax=Acanthopleuribacter pedis TaxID=442870 RepID=A0A8J7Q3C5_9BACT|nr:hypothetical protein [Acanthopleuribacter pedis]MBO1317337.1 hypothetical protein [Acanthopleuribacter pedis]MBO1318644.1 hypothetical protein [Acanthopleuribacter pedis]